MLNTAKFEKLDIIEVEKRVEKIIKKLNISDRLSLAWLKDFTYNFDLPTKEISNGYFGKIFNLLPRNISEEDMDKAVSAFNDVWNCFPQKIMGGVSPQDKYIEDVLKEEKEAEDKMKGKLPLTEEEQLWEEHFDRAKKELGPYLDWAQKEVMPKYNKYIEDQKYEKKNEMIGVAGVFLEMCGQMGFFEFQKIHPEFIADFPNMFMTSVSGHKLTKEKVKEYSDQFFSFLETYYPMNSVYRTII
jgi:hypothetical protein